MHTAKRNPLQLLEDEQIARPSTQLFYGILIHTENKLLFPALNFPNSFATIDYEVHNNTKKDFSFNHVFKTMSFAGLNTLHTICEVGKIQVLTNLAMSGKNPQLAGFLLTNNHCSFFMLKAELPGFMFILTIFHLCT